MKNNFLLIILFLLTQQLSAQILSDFYFNIISPSSVYQSLAPGEYGMASEDWAWDGTIPEDFLAEMAYAAKGALELHEFCEADTIDFTGKVVLIGRGACEFGLKALNAQNQGAIAVVIHNIDEAIIDLGAGASGSEVTIPVIIIPKSVGDGLAIELLDGNTVIVGFTHSANPFLRIDGTVRHDENLDCQATIDEPSLQGWKVHIQGTNGSSNLAYSNVNGHYQIYVDTGSYEVNLISPHPIWQACPPVTVSSSSFDSVTVDLQGQSLADCPVMSVDIEIPFLRRCFDNNTYVVDYCNLGTATGDAASVTVQFDELISIVSSTLPYTEGIDNTYEFLLGDVEPNECGSFSITTLVSCEADFEQTLCAFANIYPRENCEPGGGAYTGPSVKVRGFCSGTEVSFRIKNVGEGNMDAPSSYRVLRNDLILETGSFQLMTGTSSDYNYPADGATYRLEAVQAPGYPGESSPSFTIEACTDGADEFDTGFFNMFPPADYGMSYDESCALVIGSYDPNDKTPTPLGYGDEHFIEINTDIHYLVRFQNTGTDTAFNIVIKDTLSNSFDIPSLDLGVASHDYEFRILENNILEFKFVNIMLPDSNVNEAASHGFLTYQLKQNDNLPLGTVIRNTAAIYFDFNEPVITNETFHTIGEDFLGTNSIVTLDKNISIQVYPNPMDEYVIFNVQNADFRKGQLELYNGLGQLVQVEDFSEPVFEVKRKALHTGTYFFKLSLDDKLAGSGMIQVLGSLE